VRQQVHTTGAVLKTRPAMVGVAARSACSPARRARMRAVVAASGLYISALAVW
jgi:hypothetical protein